MTERSNLMLAALASATMPNTPVVGVRASEQDNNTDQRAGIDQAVIQDARGTLYNVYASNTAQGKQRLAGRARAAQVLSQSRELAGMGFALDNAAAFKPGKDDDPDDAAVLITLHPSGRTRALELFTLDDCASVGTAIGAIHRLRPNFLVEAQYPAFTTGQIRAQLTAWITRLQQAGHIPQEITDSWSRILETEGLWSFATCPVHGGFSDGDIIFQNSTITTITNWQGMQVNDPARDLAWIFSKLDETHRNAVIAAYGRILGSRLDDLIMLRANLWVQMEQVGDFIQALNRGDNVHIVQFKAQVDRLAHQLGVSLHRSQAHAQANAPQPSPDTVTVNTLLEAERERRERMAPAQPSPSAGTYPVAPDPDSTDERTIIGTRPQTGTQAAAALTQDDSTASHPIESVAFADVQAVEEDVTAGTVIIGINDAESLGVERTEQPASSAQQPTVTHTAPSTEAQTVLIPLLEREEQAMRDARAGLVQATTDTALTGATPDTQS